MQLTFGDAEVLCKRKQTRREIFLTEMEQVVPWPRLLGDRAALSGVWSAGPSAVRI